MKKRRGTFSPVAEGADTFSEGISSKVNVIVRLEFLLAYCNVVVQNVIHYATGIHL